MMRASATRNLSSSSGARKKMALRKICGACCGNVSSFSHRGAGRIDTAIFADNQIASENEIFLANLM